MSSLASSSYLLFVLSFFKDQVILVILDAGISGHGPFQRFKQQFSVDRIIIVFDGFCNGQIVYMIVTNLMIYDALAVEFRHCRLAVAVR